MTALEVILLIIGAIFVAVSFVMNGAFSNEEKKESENTEVTLTQEQKDSIKKQINDLVEDELTGAVEKTEVSLDKISNTKILEMNEYAENILKQINQNHNETVFLYDMLNEKAKEVKTTVKDVNVTKKQVEKIQAEVALEVEQKENVEKEPEVVETVAEEKKEDFKKLAPKPAKKPAKSKNSKGSSKKDSQQSSSNSSMTAKERLRRVKESDEHEFSKEAEANVSEEDRMDAAIRKMNEQKDTAVNNNDRILSLYREGKDNKEIAKELGLGIGEVKLVVDLYNNTK